MYMTLEGRSKSLIVTLLGPPPRCLDYKQKIPYHQVANDLTPSFFMVNPKNTMAIPVTNRSLTSTILQISLHYNKQTLEIRS